MALLFSGGTTHKINCGRRAAIDNHTTATYLAWVYCTSLSQDSGITWKGLSGSGSRQFRIDDNNDISWIVRASTSDTFANLGSGNHSVFGLNKWMFVVASFKIGDVGGIDSDQKIYIGDLVSPATEPGTYVGRNAGSGAGLDNSGQDLIIGNRENDGRNFLGSIAWIGQWSGRQLSLGEIQAQQFRPHVTANCVYFCHLGWNGTSTQPDWSGNAGAGAVTLATVSAHVPLGPAFGGNGNGVPHIVTIPFLDDFVPPNSVIRRRMEVLAF